MLFTTLATLTPESPLLAEYPSSVRDAIAYLKQTDVASLPLGKTAVDGERIFLNIQEYLTKPAEEAVLEAHRKYIDLQIVLEGKEWMGYARYEKELPTLGEYDETADVQFFPKSVMPFWAPNAESPQKFLATPGTIAIFTPQDVHASQVWVEKPQNVRKMVVKCRVF
ncbi:MAG: YhcH/YjgK/YiaL family protein [Planctomycetia bacterium]|nr:YhcH/YjgK/YiaL family protein [Planctomycetia bacterium]